MKTRRSSRTCSTRTSPAPRSTQPQAGRPDRPLLGYRLHPPGLQRPAAQPEEQRHPRPRLRIFPRPVRPGRRQEGRPVLHAQEHRHADRRDAATLQGPRVRPGHGLGRLLCAERGVHRAARRQGGQRQDRPDQRLRPGEQSHHLASGRDEHGHSRHRLQLRRRTRRHAAERPAPRPARRLRHGQPALQHEGMVERKAEPATRAGLPARRRRATPTSPGCSTCSTTWPRRAAWRCCWPMAR